ncbi:MAG: hypothetical protein J6T96_05030 [Bacteroidales bacterium]|nr:hypothetical protein [Bacteroidales bacterium]MBO7461939.1 hypothetical protein [Bacteroidales bacterium]
MNLNIMAVTGNPALHSLSPVLMNAAIQTNGLPYRYLRLPATSAQEAINTFNALDMKGMNVTAPFKREIIPFLDHLTENAKKADAVNCVYRQEDGLWGDNTDITGVELTLKQFPDYLQKGKMLVIGSGGAANAVIIAGQNLGLEVTVAARNQEAIAVLKDKYNILTASLKHITSTVNNFPIIVQALPSGAVVFDPNVLTADHVVLDANYKNSIFEKPAQTIGFHFLSGRNWLVNQAVPAFKTFTGSDVDAEVMYEALDNYHLDYQGRIALTGFMGVGKTTAGRELAYELNYRFIDMDHELERREGMKITEIFEKKGEDYFRKIESDLLLEYADEVDIILSCGGGTVKQEANRQILRDNFVTLWLYAPAAYCIDGLDVSNRPLLQCENRLEVAQNMLQERIPLYADCAYGIISVDQLTKKQTAQKLYEQIVDTFGI